MKRSIPSSNAASKAKKARVEIPDYHLTPSVKDESGNPIWPAPDDQMARARELIVECAKANQKTLICPDKDADGLTSGVILLRTLVALGLPESLIDVHLVQKGAAVVDEAERKAIASKQPKYIFILDHGSRKSPPVVPYPHKTLVIDHHYATESDFPDDSDHVTACNSPPVATTSLLTYTLCTALHPSVVEQCSWLCVIGTHGDLGSTIKWEAPFPDMTATLQAHSKKALNDAVSLVNAPRRTAAYDVASAWAALAGAADGPAPLLRNARLHEARREVAAEVERWTHTAPRFSADARVAVLRIASAAQVHPVVATRWAAHLRSSKLEVVMVANDGYLPGRVSFSCRIPKCARARDPPVNLIETLRGIAEGGEDGLLERLGDSFARGHKEASGGIISKECFEELMGVMGVGEKPVVRKAGENKKSVEKGTQRNTLMNYFAKSGQDLKGGVT